MNKDNNEDSMEYKLSLIKKCANPIYYEFFEFYVLENENSFTKAERYISNLNADELQLLIKLLIYIQEQINDLPEYKIKTLAFNLYDLTNDCIKEALKNYGVAWLFFIINLVFLDGDHENKFFTDFYQNIGINIIKSGKNITHKTSDDLIIPDEYYKPKPKTPDTILF